MPQLVAAFCPPPQHLGEEAGGPIGVGDGNVHHLRDKSPGGGENIQISGHGSLLFESPPQLDGEADVGALWPIGTAQTLEGVSHRLPLSRRPAETRSWPGPVAIRWRAR